MRNLLIIDSGFLAAVSHTICNCPGIDILKLKILLEDRFGRMDRSYMYTTLNTESQAGFHTWLGKMARIEAVPKGTKFKSCKACGTAFYVEAGVDVAMSVAMIKFAHNDLYDRVILLNGDRDLIDAVKYVRDDLHKQVVLVGEITSMSAEMLSNCDEYIDLSDPDVTPHILK